MKAAWKVDGIFRCNANDVKKELDTLGEQFTPRDVVELARNESTALHKCFEWDDSIAAEKYREEQAKMVIRMIVYVDEQKNEKTNIRVLVSSGERDNTYMQTRLVVQNKTEYEELLERAMRELRAFKEKYKSLKELDYILELID